MLWDVLMNPWVRAWAALVTANVLFATGTSYAHGGSPNWIEYIRNAGLIWGGVVIFAAVIRRGVMIIDRD